MSNRGFVIVLAAFALSCGRKDDDGDGSLASDELMLVDDFDQTEQQEAELEAGLEEPLSGAEPAEPALAPDPATAEATLSALLRANPGRFFMPSGCIATSVVDNVATHVFSNCTGPQGLARCNGTVTSTWSRAAGRLKVTHEMASFQLNGATINGAIDIEYSREGTVHRKTRTAVLGGRLASRQEWSRTATFETTYDSASKCITRGGTATAIVAGRSLTSTITGYRRCGIGALGCPSGGTITLERASPSLQVKLEFPGGARVQVTRPNGRKVIRPLLCRP